MVGRNDPCPCGSGKKSKKCCGESVVAEANAAPPRRRLSGPVVKTPDEIAGMRRAGELAGRILREAVALVQPGVTTQRLDDFVRERTLEAGAYPAPLNYPHAPTDPRNPRIAPGAFPRSVCTSVNDVVCHGIPDGTVLCEGDIVNVDVTVNLEGFFGDTSLTVYVGEVAESARRLTELTRTALDAAIQRVRDGALFWEIGDAIQSIADREKLSVVREFTGHGIGRMFHEPPPILHYRSEEMRFPMRAGMIFTIEPMLNLGSHRVKVDARDGWTARTVDGSLSAQFEHTILVTETGAEILTQAA